MRDRESLKSPTANKSITAFLSRLAKVRSSALLLDYDGTLAPFSFDPAQARPYPEIKEALSRIQRETDTRLVVVTGRRACDVLRLLKLSDIEVWGCHGLERLRADGSLEIARIDARILVAIETVNKLIACEGLSSFAERKIASIAIHWRGREAISQHVMRRMNHIWSMIPDRDDLRFAPFEGGIEIRPAKTDKGNAVRSIFTEMGPDVAAAYLGDDETDEAAFRALSHRGLNVLVREEYRRTLADAWIKPPEALLEFLGRWISACRANDRSADFESVSMRIVKSQKPFVNSNQIGGNDD